MPAWIFLDHLKYKCYCTSMRHSLLLLFNLLLETVLNVALKLISSLWFTLVRYQSSKVGYNNKQIRQTKQYQMTNSVAVPTAVGPSCDWLRDLTTLTHQRPRQPLRRRLILFTVVSVASEELHVPPRSVSSSLFVEHQLLLYPPQETPQWPMFSFLTL